MASGQTAAPEPPVLGELGSRCGSIVSASVSLRLQRSRRLYQQLLADAAAGLTFSQDAAVDLVTRSVPYDQADVHQVLGPSRALKPPAKRKTQERKRYRAAPRPPEPFRSSLDSEDQSPPQLQDSCRRTRPTGAGSTGHRLKRASGLSKPVHKAAHQNQDQIILDKPSKYHKKLQKWSSTAPQRWTGPDKMASSPHDKSLTTDQTDPVDQVRTAVLSRPPSPQSGSDVEGWLAAQRSALDRDPSQRVLQRLVALLFLRKDRRPSSQNEQPDPCLDRPPSSLDRPPSSLDGTPSSQNEQPDPCLDRPPSSLDRPPSSQNEQPDPCLDRPPGILDRPPSSLDEQPDAQLVVSLLTSISCRTTVVRSLLAEQLNSSEWRRRLASCRVLCSLRGPINKDVVHKLTHLMCNDHCAAVRHAAADTLMKLGNIHHIHAELRLKLEGGRSPRSRLEVLDLIDHLKLTTAAPLELLMSCFSDEFTAVRKQACLTAASLLLKEETVVSRLLQLIENDTAPEVRLAAVTVVGALGLPPPGLRDTLLRCVQTEGEAAVREAAYRLLQSAGVPSGQLQDFLLQQVEVESSWVVRRTMREVLQELSAHRRPAGDVTEALQVGTFSRLLSQRHVFDCYQVADQD